MQDEITLRYMEKRIAHHGIPTLWEEFKFIIGCTIAVAKEIIGL